MKRSPFIPSCFTMQMFFYHMFRNMLMITCSTKFQGAVNIILIKNVIKFFSRQVSMHTNYSISWLPLLSQHPRATPRCSAVLRGFICQVGCPKGNPVKSKAASQVTTLRTPPSRAQLQHWEAGRGSTQGRRALQTKPLTQKGWEQTNSVKKVQALFGYHRTTPCRPASFLTGQFTASWRKITRDPEPEADIPSRNQLSHCSVVLWEECDMIVSVLKKDPFFVCVPRKDSNPLMWLWGSYINFLCFL